MNTENINIQSKQSKLDMASDRVRSEGQNADRFESVQAFEQSEAPQRYVAQQKSEVNRIKQKLTENEAQKEDLLQTQCDVEYFDQARTSGRQDQPKVSEGFSQQEQANKSQAWSQSDAQRKSAQAQATKQKTEKQCMAADAKNISIQKDKINIDQAKSIVNAGSNAQCQPISQPFSQATRDLAEPIATLARDQPQCQPISQPFSQATRDLAEPIATLARDQAGQAKQACKDLTSSEIKDQTKL